MISQDQLGQLCEDNELAFFRADVCLGSPHSFTLEEKSKICDDMEKTNAAIEVAIRKDFESLPRVPGQASRLALRLGLHDAGMVEGDLARPHAVIRRRYCCK